MRDTFRAELKNNILQQVPLFNSPKAGKVVKNWLAIISPDPKNRAYHIERDFMPKVNLDKGYYIFIDKLKIGTPVEFGTTVTMSDPDRPYKDRWYGVIVDITDEAVYFLPTASAKEAMEYSTKTEFPNALTPQEQNLSRLAKIKSQIEELIKDKANISDRIDKLCDERDRLAMVSLNGESEEKVTISPFDELMAKYH